MNYGYPSILVLCFEGDTMNSDNPVLFGHLMKVTVQVVIWDTKINFSECLADEIPNILKEHINFYIEDGWLYLNFPQNVYKINVKDNICSKY